MLPTKLNHLQVNIKPTQISLNCLVHYQNHLPYYIYTCRSMKGEGPLTILNLFIALRLTDEWNFSIHCEKIGLVYDCRWPSSNKCILLLNLHAWKHVGFVVNMTPCTTTPFEFCREQFLFGIFSKRSMEIPQKCSVW